MGFTIISIINIKILIIIRLCNSIHQSRRFDREKSISENKNVKVLNYHHFSLSHHQHSSSTEVRAVAVIPLDVAAGATILWKYQS